MNACYFDGKTLRLKEVPKPARKGGEALIRILYSGICNTDLEILRGYLGFRGIPGHEFVGIVEEADSESWHGKRVVGEINCGCGRCSFCRQGMQRHCPEREVLGIVGKNGSHAEYITLPQENLHEVPEPICNEDAVFVEPLAAALEIAEQVHLQPGMRAVVLGDGKLGQLIARVFQLYGADLTVIGKHPQKIRCLTALGIRAQAGTEGIQDADLVVECTGNPEGLALAERLLKPRGTLVLKSTYSGEFLFNPAQWVIREYTVVGSRCGPFEPAIRLLESGKITVRDLIFRIFPSERAGKAFSVAQEKDVLKILIQWI